MSPLLILLPNSSSSDTCHVRGIRRQDFTFLVLDPWSRLLLYKFIFEENIFSVFLIVDDFFPLFFRFDSYYASPFVWKRVPSESCRLFQWPGSIEISSTPLAFSRPQPSAEAVRLSRARARVLARPLGVEFLRP